METKADIRRRILRIRQNISKEQQDTWSRIIQEQIARRPQLKRTEWVYLYMDYKSEVQTGLLLEECLKMGKRIAIPKVEGDEMHFYEIKDRTDVRSGYRGIPEPCTHNLVENEHAFMVVPGVAFSEDRRRIGYGKGFYDRYLHRFPEIYTCAAAYECQVLEQLPYEEHDVAINELITEGVIRC